MGNEWLKLSDWRYKHSAASMSIDHDTDGWVLNWTTEGRMWPNKFKTAEAAMQFAKPWTARFEEIERRIA